MPETLSTTFADPEDLRRYREAIANGASEEEALKVGDNGLGAWGDDTTSTTDPIVALPPNMPGVYHNRLVQIQGPNGMVVARIGDKGPDNGRIDLNPAAAAAIGHPGGVAPVKWTFLDGNAPAQPKVDLSDSAPVSFSAMPDLAPAIDLASNTSNIPGIFTADNTLNESGDWMGNEGVVSTDNSTYDQSDVNSPGMKTIPAPPLPPPDKTRFNPSDGSIEWDDGHGGTIKMTGPNEKKAYYYPPAQEKKSNRFVDKNGNLWERGTDGQWQNNTPEGATGVRSILTPAEKLSARKNERQTFNDNQATIMMYGKGQMPGLYQIKSRLDALYDTAKGDYNKLKDSPQSQATFVYQFSKFNDPNSAVLLGEYNAAAGRLGIADRFKLAIDKAKRGDVLTETQMRDIQHTINTAYEHFKNDHFSDLRQREPELEDMELSLQKLGVPPQMIGEYEQWKKTQGEKTALPEPSPSATPAPTVKAAIMKDKSTGKYFIPNPGGGYQEVDLNGNPI